MPTASREYVRPGDRILLRERPWHVKGVTPLSENIALLELQATDGEEPLGLSVAVPPDKFVPLPNEQLSFENSAIEAYGPWRNLHRILLATAVKETGILSGACFGRVNLESYQLAPTRRVLSKPRPSLLIADDVGLGKTIEAGLILLELMARRRVNRVLIVAPPGLLLQWRDELHEKFGLEFTIIDNASGLSRVQGDLPAGVSPWDALPRILTSIDFLKKETMRNRALRKCWDLVIVDEAHAVSEAGTLQNPYKTQRTRLGIALQKQCRGLILLTATPHNGYAHSFRSLLKLVDPTIAIFYGKPEDISRRVQRAMVRRMKDQIFRMNTKKEKERVFPQRFVEGIPVHPQGLDLELLQKIGSYCSKTAKAAKGTDDDELISFAMQIVKKRALSSRRALETTIKNRLDALQKESESEQEPPPTRIELQELRADLPLSDAAAERTAQRLVKSSIPKEERLRKAEVKTLKAIQKLLRSLSGNDLKVEALLQEIHKVISEKASEKIIVFTEYLDTLESIRTVLESDPILAGKVVILKGGMSGKQRLLVEERFAKAETRVLLATDAASEGLNLQEHCHRVIHFELPWNPNRMEQRNGRVDRYGQTKEPIIRYLFYPESPEDDVLHRLVGKIETMKRDQISTPDILGVYEGDDEIRRGLTEIDPESGDVEEQKRSLVARFEDRTAEFTRNIKPLVSQSSESEDLLNTSRPLLSDDSSLEEIMIAILGSGNVKPTEREAIFRIEVPLRFRGPDVQPSYPMATFRRSIAAQHSAKDVEFITPIHPLARALAAEARKRLLQLYPDRHGLTPRRLAARRVSVSEPASVLFTFFGAITGGGGLLEEQLIAVRITSDFKIIGNQDQNLRWLEPDSSPGEVSFDMLSKLFGRAFEQMAKRAAEDAQKQLRERSGALRKQRREQADILRKDLQADLQDRLKEIEETERQVKGLVEGSGQLRMDVESQRSSGGFEDRRAAAKVQAEAKEFELAEFEHIDEPGEPRPLGALFLVPEGLN